ncbi:YigZ family protein [Alkalibacter rhizosphaerae]|uniref:YigZ family protein n=1 Tax=Alkalibacter rhizosphaerae TaxID=2815577 RepID=A0A974XF96_9FIRM|nr:YigZ family protein [Alkalibacter rhizosphaerae]QSX08787.1 YigZ family protein [Alkalibacter rhizosphaerae]
MVEQYKTIREAVMVELVIKKSKFIGMCFPVSSVEEAEEIIHKIQKEHYKATHNTYAYVLEADASVFKYSDDGEPSLTAGKPMYDTIMGMGFTNVLVLVTRYFGGIKLGTGGLARAYGQSAKDALEAAVPVLMKRYQRVKLDVDYGLIGSLQHYLDKFDHQLAHIEYLEEVTFHIDVAVSQVGSFQEGIREMTSGQVLVEGSKEHYLPEA